VALSEALDVLIRQCAQHHTAASPWP
jgi:hypothetical protein